MQNGKNEECKKTKWKRKDSYGWKCFYLHVVILERFQFFCNLIPANAEISLVVQRIEKNNISHMNLVIHQFLVPTEAAEAP